MQIAASAMRRDYPSSRANRLSCVASPEKEEHCAGTGIQGAITLIGIHSRKTEKFFVETRAPLNVLYVQAGFEDADHVRHSNPLAAESRRQECQESYLWSIDVGPWSRF